MRDFARFFLAHLLLTLPASLPVALVWLAVGR
jgi:hypothetical protein